MRTESTVLVRAARGLALGAVALLGVASIVGSGGGIDAPQCSFFSNVCEPVIDPQPGVPSALVEPQRKTVQAGATVRYTVQTTAIASPTYQWQRSADGGRTYVDIGGATAETYTLGSAQPTDDGALFAVRVRAGSTGAVTLSSAGALAVSPLPGVAFSDGDFAPANWLASATADPAQGGPTHTEARIASGGNPDAFRRMLHTMSAGPSSLVVLHTNAAASYSAAALGAINVIDYEEDCSRLSTTTAASVSSMLLLEQAGRRYLANRTRVCGTQAWAGAALLSLRASEFTLHDGPACGATEACPDFSAAGAPLRLGFARRAAIPAASPAGSIEHGIDNWKVTVWRR